MPKIEIEMTLSPEDRKLMEELTVALESARQRCEVDVTIRQIEVATEDPDKFAFDLARIKDPKFE